MIPYERRQILLNELEKQDMVTLSDFARALHGVSESTIRRDLKILEGEGQIVLLRGGAAKIKTGSYDTPIHSRGLYKIKEKEAIARTAAKLVHDGEVIYIDSGTTCLKMISYLKNKRITVVTTNAMVVPSILETDIHVIMIGGDVLKSTASIVGSITDNSLKDMFLTRRLSAQPDMTCSPASTPLTAGKPIKKDHQGKLLRSICTGRQLQIR